MSLVAYSVLGIFNTDAFSFQLPMLAALTAALVRTSAPEIAAGEMRLANQVAPTPYRFVNRRVAGLQAPATN
jgi:hypothetical protein